MLLGCRTISFAADTMSNTTQIDNILKGETTLVKCPHWPINFDKYTFEVIFININLKGGDFMRKNKNAGLEVKKYPGWKCRARATNTKSDSKFKQDIIKVYHKFPL